MSQIFEKASLREVSDQVNPTQEASVAEEMQVEHTSVKKAEREGEESVEVLEKISRRIQATHNAVEELATLFQNRLSYDANQEKVIDQMHAELQRYKNDLFGTLIRPILVDIIEVVDSIRKTGEAFAATGEAEGKAAAIITDYIEDLHNLLASYNVEVYKSTPGDSYTPIKQRIVSYVTTGEVALNGKLVESLGFGYLHNGKVIWAEKVKVYKYQLM